MENTTERTAKVTFYGGTGSVTGSNFLLEIDGLKVLVDCGLTQGEKLADDVNWSPFLYNPIHTAVSLSTCIDISV